MLHEKYFAYDKLEIPEDIKKMTKEELCAEIERFEKELQNKNKVLCKSE